MPFTRRSFFQLWYWWHSKHRPSANSLAGPWARWHCWQVLMPGRRMSAVSWLEVACAWQDSQVIMRCESWLNSACGIHRGVMFDLAISGSGPVSMSSVWHSLQVFRHIRSSASSTRNETHSLASRAIRSTAGFAGIWRSKRIASCTSPGCPAMYSENRFSRNVCTTSGLSWGTCSWPKRLSKSSRWQPAQFSKNLGVAMSDAVWEDRTVGFAGAVLTVRNCAPA